MTNKNENEYARLSNLTMMIQGEKMQSKTRHGSVEIKQAGS